MPLRERIALELSRSPRAFWHVFAVVLLNRSGAWVFPFLMLYLTTRRGLPIDTAGSVLSCLGAGAICAALIGGQLADHWGRRRTILLSMFGGAIAVTLLSQATTRPQVFGAAFLFGAVAEMYRPAVSAHVSDVVAAEHQGVAFGHLYWAHNFGFAIAPAAAGMVVAAYGFTPLFVVQVLTLIACGLGALSLDDTKRARASTALPTAPGLGLAALRDPLFVTFLAAFAPIPLLMLQTVSVLPTLMQSDGIDAAAYGKIISVNGLLIVLLQPWLIARLAQLDRTRVLVVGALCLGLGYGGHALARNAGEHLLTLVLWTYGEIAIVPMAAGVVAELAPPSQRGRYQGVYGLTWSFAQLTSPWVATIVLTRIGQNGWGMCCALAGCISATLYILFGARRALTAKAPGS